MKYLPKISVITVVYNTKEPLKKTIHSIINQNYGGLEYLIIDGGSTDGTLEVIKSFSKNVHHWITEKDNGIYDAMNKALHLATGDFIIFMNAGDEFFSPNTLTSISKKITDNNAIYYGNSVLILDKMIKGKYQGSYNSFRLTNENICHQAIFYPKAVYKKYDFDLKYKIYADWAYNIINFKKTKFIYINETICNYDISGFSQQNNKDNSFLEDFSSIVRKHLGFSEWLYFIIRKKIRSVIQSFGLLNWIRRIKLMFQPQGK